MGAGGPKAFVPVAGRRMVDWSIEACRAAPSVRSIVVACPPGHVHDLAGHDIGVVDGGATRAESVANALSAVGTELVAIHDAARPLLTPELLEGVIATLLDDPDAAGAIAAVPVADTIKRVAPVPDPRDSARDEQAAGARRDPSTPEHGKVRKRAIEGTVDRSGLWAAQTPQVFRAAHLRAALPADPRGAEATDEAMIVEASGGRVLIHESTPENLKVTTPHDLRLAELLLEERAAAGS